MDCGTDREETLASIILSRLPEIGAGRHARLREHFGTSRAVLDAAADRLRETLPAATLPALLDYQRRAAAHPLHQRAEADLQWLEDRGARLLRPEDADYPALLKTIHQAPPLLYVRGSVDNLALPQLAVVGSRKPSPSGRSNAFNFSRQLSAAGFAITSGLALGVDAQAHRGALAADGPTIAVLGTGVDRIYPRRHLALAEEILERGGSIVSEFPLGTSAQASHFPRRNRIISGLSLGVLVVEAAIRSGSLITARLAMQQGREVFAIPGSIHNPLSRGCHALLRDGATLVEELVDFREALQGVLAFKWAELEGGAGERSSASLEPDEGRLLEQIGFEDAALDQIVAASGLDTGRVLGLLMQLEIKGLIQQTSGGYQRRVATSTVPDEA